MIIILILTVGCQSDSTRTDLTLISTQLPTLMVLPSPTERILHALNPSAAPTDLPSRTPSASATISAATQTPTATSAFTATITTTNTPTSIPTRKPLPDAFIFGRSAGGRDLTARRFGNGSRMIMLVGGVHGGWESNTVDLMNALINHFQTTPSALLPDVSILIVPALNPDGVALGQNIQGRFNGNGVDLNRNWDCGWEPVAYFRQDEVNPGAYAFSEPESQALAALIFEQRPDVVLFYHSAADGVFAGGCGGDGSASDALAQVVGEASGYSYGSEFSAYPVTGTGPAWVNSIGIPSADVELATATGTEFDRNLRAVNAVQCWLTVSDAANSGVCN